jgi:glycine dehydrogenase subunit 1
MGSYTALTGEDRQEMLAFLGRADAAELFAPVPQDLQNRELRLPPGLSELALRRRFEALAGENRVFPSVFRGAGAYRHYIPAAVRRITAAESFITAYTPYQPELSQGILQSIFEYQTMICELTGMEVSNASVYDGSSAAAEAVNMCRERDRLGVFVSAGAHPHTLAVLRTYCAGYGMPLTVVPLGPDGCTGGEALAELLEGEAAGAAAVYVQNPNFFGLIEDVPALARAAHAAGARLVAGVNPLSLGLLECPGVQGADIAVGEGQPLGLPLAFGGPYLGFMACTAPLLRRLPGRIVGETTDSRGERAFVLTLQAREQHIRREKASSNICSNQAHCALTAAVYLAVMGEEGFIEASRQCHDKAVYAAGKISRIPGFSLVYDGPFFHEFVTRCPDTEAALAMLEREGILGGYPLSAGELLWCVTEANSREEIDYLAELLSSLPKGTREMAGGSA